MHGMRLPKMDGHIVIDPVDRKRYFLIPIHDYAEDFHIVTVADILESVAKHASVTVAALKSQRRAAEIVRWRQVAYWLAHHHTGASFPQIGALIGGRDHTTIMSGVKTIDAILERPHHPLYPAVAELMQAVERDLSLGG